MILVFYLCDVVTSGHHGMTSQNLVQLSQRVNVRER